MSMLKKRVRYKIPTYKKSEKIITNIKAYKKNQRHIFRYSALQKIYEEIASIVITSGTRLNNQDLTVHLNGLVIYFDVEYGNYIERFQAEIENTQYLNLKERLKLHISLLRCLRKGLSVTKALELINCPFQEAVN